MEYIGGIPLRSREDDALVAFTMLDGIVGSHVDPFALGLEVFDAGM